MRRPGHTLAFMGVLIAGIAVGALTVFVVLKQAHKSAPVLPQMPAKAPTLADLPPLMAPTELMPKTFEAPIENPKQVFENQIADFMFVSLDDMKHGWMDQPIDIAARRNFFTADAWIAYQGYVTHQKEILNTKTQEPGRVPQASVIIDPDSMKFSRDDDGDAVFKAQGNFCYGYGDFAGCGSNEFKLRIVFSGDVQDPANIQIKTWDVE